MKEINVSPIPSRSQKDTPGWALLLFSIPMVLCCGLPLIVAGLATASALTKGILGGVLVAVVGIVVTFAIRRSMHNKANCCALPTNTTPSPASSEVDHSSRNQYHGSSFITEEQQ